MSAPGSADQGMHTKLLQGIANILNILSAEGRQQVSFGQRQSRQVLQHMVSMVSC